MQNKFYHFEKDKLDKSVFDTLLEHRLYHSMGVFRRVYVDPDSYCSDDCHLGVVENDEGNPVSMLFIAKNNFYGWATTDNLPDYHGMIGFYTLPAYRHQGLATGLFEEFDRTFKLRKLVASRRASSIIKSLNRDEYRFL